MLKIFYTNAPKFGAEQLEPSRSIGGWFSSTLVPNGGEDSIFQAVGLLSLLAKRKTTICLAIQGEAVRIALRATPSDVFDFACAVGKVSKVEQTADIKTNRYHSEQSLLGANFSPQLTFKELGEVELTPVEGWSVIWLQRTFKKELPIIDELPSEEITLTFEALESEEPAEDEVF